jgi:hypothetical protein
MEAISGYYDVIELSAANNDALKRTRRELLDTNGVYHFSPPGNLTHGFADLPGVDER